MTDYAQVVELLTKARERIRGHFYKGNYAPDADEGYDAQYDKCPVCIYGALNWAAFGDPFGDQFPPTDTHIAAEEFLLECSPGHKDPAGFNDDPDTTEDDVVALYDRAIEAAQELVDAQ